MTVELPVNFVFDVHRSCTFFICCVTSWIISRQISWRQQIICLRLPKLLQAFDTTKLLAFTSSLMSWFGSEYTFLPLATRDISSLLSRVWLEKSSRCSGVWPFIHKRVLVRPVWTWNMATSIASYAQKKTENKTLNLVRPVVRFQVSVPSIAARSKLLSG